MLEMKLLSGHGDISEAIAIRVAVFVEEQGFPANTEPDSIDPVALHALALEGGKPAATARLYALDGVWHIGRVAVLAEYRGRSIGFAVMRLLMQKAMDLGAAEAHVGAQVRAEGFYRSLGFARCGEEYDEDGVPHVPMKADLAAVQHCCHEK